MSRTACRLCGGDLSPSASHVPTPELAGPGERVYWCQRSQRHVVVRPSWREDLSRTGRGLVDGIGRRLGL